MVFSIKTNDCIDPTLSVIYEAIDFSENTASETFNVLDSNGNLITNCAGGGQCAAWQTCLDSADVLGVDKIDADSTYAIKIETGDQFHVLCSSNHLFSFLAKVTLHCAAAPSSKLSSI